MSESQKDLTELTWQQRRDVALELGKAWVDAMLRDYIEPTRVGTPKGDPIGFSLQKRKASLLMILHPYSLQLKDIAKLAGVSEGVLRVWRTKEDFFEEAEFKAIGSFGECFVNTIEGGLEGEEVPSSKTILKAKTIEMDPFLLITLVPFFNYLIIIPLRELFEKKLESDNHQYALLAAAYLRTVYDLDFLEASRAWSRQLPVLDFNQFLIAYTFDVLLSSYRSRELPAEKFKEIADLLKDIIARRAAILAKW